MKFPRCDLALSQNRTVSERCLSHYGRERWLRRDRWLRSDVEAKGQQKPGSKRTAWSLGGWPFLELGTDKSAISAIRDWPTSLTAGNSWQPLASLGKKNCDEPYCRARRNRANATNKRQLSCRRYLHYGIRRSASPSDEIVRPAEHSVAQDAEYDVHTDHLTQTTP